MGAAVAVKMLTRASTVDWEERDGHHPALRPFAVYECRRHSHSLSGIWRRERSADHPDPRLHGVGLCLENVGTADRRDGFSRDRDRSCRFWLLGKTALVRILDRTRRREWSRDLWTGWGLGAPSLGSSYGGAVAATLALDYPERVEKLVLVDAVINDDLKSHPILRLASLRGVGEMITPFLADSKTADASPYARHDPLGRIITS